MNNFIVNLNARRKSNSLKRNLQNLGSKQGDGL